MHCAEGSCIRKATLLRAIDVFAHLSDWRNVGEVIVDKCFITSFAPPLCKSISRRSVGTTTPCITLHVCWRNFPIALQNKHTIQTPGNHTSLGIPRSTHIIKIPRRYAEGWLPSHAPTYHYSPISKEYPYFEGTWMCTGNNMRYPILSIHHQKHIYPHNISTLKARSLLQTEKLLCCWKC